MNPANNRYPAEVCNINNAARNLLEIIANAARNDDGDYPIRIYTIGMGDLVRYDLGTMPEKPEDILKRIANDLRSTPDRNPAQLEGKYYFAKTEADVSPRSRRCRTRSSGSRNKAGDGRAEVSPRRVVERTRRAGGARARPGRCRAGRRCRGRGSGEPRAGRRRAPRGRTRRRPNGCRAGGRRGGRASLRSGCGLEGRGRPSPRQATLDAVRA